MDIESLCGDSTVTSFTFDGKTLSFYYDDHENDVLCKIDVPTTRVLSKAPGYSFPCVHIRWLNLKDLLEVDKDSNLYVMPNGFVEQMKAVRKGCHICVGLDSREFKEMFMLIGNSIICVCPIESREGISVHAV